MIEWKKLGEVCEVLDSQRKPVSKSNRVQGEFPYYGANGIQDHVDKYIFDGTYLLLGEDGSVINKDNSPVLHWATGKIWVNNHAHILQENSEAKLRYLYYSLQCIDVSDIVRGMPPKINQANMCNILIPIPSISEQQRIVGILDTFTASIDNLKEQIAQRRKQYEYYRDQLLDLEGKPGVEMKALNDCCTLITKQTGFDYSKTIKPSLTTNQNEDSIPFIQNKDFEGTRVNLNTDFYIPISVAKKFPKILLNEKILLISISGKIGNVGLYEIGNISFVGGAICVCRLRKNISGKYILYYLQSNKGQGSLFHSVKAASHSNITVESIRLTTIPFPAMVEQQRIVSILDKFEASIQNLEAQLSQREKQYEYYRNKLLTFE